MQVDGLQTELDAVGAQLTEAQDALSEAQIAIQVWTIRMYEGKEVQKEVQWNDAKYRLNLKEMERDE